MKDLIESMFSEKEITELNDMTIRCSECDNVKGNHTGIYESLCDSCYRDELNDPKDPREECFKCRKYVFDLLEDGMCYHCLKENAHQE